MNITERCAV